MSIIEQVEATFSGTNPDWFNWDEITDREIMYMKGKGEDRVRMSHHIQAVMQFSCYFDGKYHYYAPFLAVMDDILKIAQLRVNLDSLDKIYVSTSGNNYECELPKPIMQSNLKQPNNRVHALFIGACFTASYSEYGIIPFFIPLKEAVAGQRGIVRDTYAYEKAWQTICRISSVPIYPEWKIVLMDRFIAGGWVFRDSYSMCCRGAAVVNQPDVYKAIVLEMMAQKTISIPEENSPQGE